MTGAGLSRRALLGGAAQAAVALGLSAAPSRILAASNQRRISAFGRDGVALQRAFDWAHETHGTLLLDREVVVDRTVFMGNLHLVDAGGRILILADDNYTRPPKESPRGWAAISMRSAPKNPYYAEPITRRYLVRIERGCRIDFLRTNPHKPHYPMRFTGLRDGSYIYPDFTARSTIDSDCNGPDWYFYNRCRIGGTYSLTFDRGRPTGGFWLRDVDEERLGSAYYSRLELDDPVFRKIGGHDECVAIFTTFDDPGHLRASGSLTVAQSNSLGFSILNRSKAPPKDFQINLDRVVVSSTVRDNQPVAKIDDDFASIGSLEATVTGEASGTNGAAVLVCENRSGTSSSPRIGSARLASKGGGARGYRNTVAMRGRCAIDRSAISELTR
ncbi:MAG: hypothetical protein R3E14_05935 [Erythrobacter sp.]